MHFFYCLSYEMKSIVIKLSLYYYMLQVYNYIHINSIFRKKGNYYCVVTFFLHFLKTDGISLLLKFSGSLASKKLSLTRDNLSQSMYLSYLLGMCHQSALVITILNYLLTVGFYGSQTFKISL